MRVFLALVPALALAACIEDRGGSARSSAPAVGRFSSIELPPMHRFAAGSDQISSRSNDEIYQDFMDLSFKLETGRELDLFSRFSVPLTVRVMGAVPPTAMTDLAVVLSRLRSEAGLSIETVTTGQAAFAIEFLPQRELQARARDAACFVAPRVSSWAEYRGASAHTINWTDYARRERAAIFIPSDTSPQEVRDCLNEELAQALGPLNDLYRLPDSVFNDDNIEGVLTGFDMAILRATYSDRLQPGMTKTAVAQLLPAVLADVNPSGNKSGGGTAPTPRAYGEAIQRALGHAGFGAGRLAAAEEALSFSQGWQDWRTAFAWMAVGRVTPDPTTAQQAFHNASLLYHGLGLSLHAANADLQLSMFALRDGRWADAVRIADGAAPGAISGQNAALLASLLMVKASALERMGKGAEAAAVRLDSLGWARYGIGKDAEIKKRLTQIDALAENAGKPKT